jgi:alpha-maltose-1-phosphate synthase
MADAVVAVSEGTRTDILRLFNMDPARIRIIYNGIDPEEYYPRKSTDLLEKNGINPAEPFVLFVGRIARQKGIIHLVNAIKYMDPGFQVVLCAGAPDTPEIAEEMKRAVGEAQSKREGVIWIDKMVTKDVVYQLYTHAAVFVCPSIYEPFGIINLEAMACETAVVAAAVGGIKEVVVDGETGFLVPLEQMQTSPFEPVDPDKFSRDMAEKINRLMADEPLRKKFGEAGRRRAVDKFSWATIAAETKKMYESLL